MTKKLPKMLEYYNATPSERKAIRNTESFKKTVLAGMPKSKKELLLTEAAEEDTLLQEEVLKTIVEGARRWRCMRDLLPIEKTNTNSVRVVYQDSASGFAAEIPLGGKIPVNHDSFSYTTINIKKYGDRPTITEDLIEDCLWDRVALELDRLGERMENTFNRECMDAMLSSSPNTANAATGGITPKNIATSIKNVKVRGYMPTHLVLHPTADGELMQSDYLLKANESGSDRLLRNGDVGELFGLRKFIYSIENGNWNDTDGSGYYAWIGDPSRYAKVMMRREISFKKYEDPIYDLIGISATMRFGVGKLQNDAGEFIVNAS